MGWGCRCGCEVCNDGLGIVALEGGGEVLDAVVVCGGPLGRCGESGGELV